jgi:membrane protease YdiL (CAAX protease family)
MTEPRRMFLGRPAIVWWGTGFEAALGILAILIGWWFNQPPLATLSWDADGLWVGLLASVPMLIGFALCVRWPLGPLARIKTFSDEVIRPLFAPCTIVELALISLAAGVGEELLFRGLIQAFFTEWWGAWVGIGLASLIFGLMHLITPTYFVLAALLGIYLGSVWNLGGNLLSVITAHALYDFVALVYLVKIAPAPETTSDAPPES